MQRPHLPFLTAGPQLALPVLALLAAAPLTGTAQVSPVRYDVIIRGGRILDGSGNPFFRADVGIRGDTVITVGQLGQATAGRVIDARGRYVTPGFIALHEHIESAIRRGYGTLPNFTTQGFATAVINADGRTGTWPIARQRVELEQAGSALNLVMMVGHGTVRAMAMGEDTERPATAAEIERMTALVRQGMDEGAFGLSTGLEYEPMRYSTEEEVLELAKAVAPYGGHYQAHLRSQGQHPKWQLPSYDSKPITNIDAVMETINIARLAGIPAMMDHLHPKGPREWGSGRIITQLVDRARRDGHEVYINMHSYEAYDENIVLVPRWALIARPVKNLGQFDSNVPGADYTNMRGNLQRRLGHPDTARVIRRDIAYEIDRGGGPDGLLIMDFADKAQVGKTLAQVARARNEDPVETAIWMHLNGLDRPGGVEWRSFAVSLLDLEEFMRQDYTGVCTDRSGDTPSMRENRFVHPGTFGTTTRLIRVFALDKGVITLPHAIRSLTGLPAQILGLTDRGRLAPGMRADVVVFDPETIRDKGTYFEPFQYSEGIEYVLVNGRLVVDGGRPTEAKPGQVLSRQRSRSAAR
ncbi:MAG TPA: amidohydrolase family protein [Gemmatimonadales bacterium]|nr:amidohydrolase family protein [Gemmatimonadales bacterium]